MVYLKVLSTQFASTYGSADYGRAAYSNSVTSTSAAAPVTSSGALLTNTGFDVMLAVSLACLIIFVALIVRFWKRPTTKPI